MIVHGGLGWVMSSKDAGSASHVREVFGCLRPLTGVLDGKDCVRIPAGQAFIMIGGRASLYSDLENLQNKKIKFVTKDASGIVVTSQRAGSKVASASRFLGRSLSIGLKVASLPTGVPALLKGGSFSENYGKGMKAFKTVAKNPSMIGNASKTVTYTVVQIMGKSAGSHADEIMSCDFSDIYINNLFNTLLSAGAIKWRKMKNSGPGGGAVNFGDDEDDDDL
jgi:hypothetical protein